MSIGVEQLATIILYTVYSVSPDVLANVMFLIEHEAEKSVFV